MKNANWQKRLKAIKARYRELAAESADDVKANRNVRMAIGTVVGEVQFLLGVIDNLMGGHDVEAEAEADAEAALTE